MKYLYDIKDSDKFIYFIEESDLGELISNQTGGCACHHPSIKGILHVFAPNDYKLDSFNPDWWYNRIYREDGTLDSKLGDEIEFEGIKWRESWNLYRDIKIDKKNEPKQKKDEDIFVWIKRRHDWVVKNNPEMANADRICNELEKLIPQHSQFLKWSQLLEKVENDINLIKPDNVDKVFITRLFDPVHKIHSEEAWIYVDVIYKNGDIKRGCVSWENCD